MEPPVTGLWRLPVYGASALVRMNVLIVDDSPPCRRLLRATLESNGLRVLEATDGEHALALLEQAPVGRDLAETLWAEAPQLPVILTSGYSPQMAGQEDGGGESVPFLQKPYSPDRLAYLVREVLDGPAVIRSGATTGTNGPSSDGCHPVFCAHGSRS